ncbi:RNA degradosome polyphosphate kinase [Ligilactobacillus sp. Marseille-Q7487]|uniref:RNA degradosome polyphosphate kinase n=1 Tax=Ligilactobacillus sp. Marseille-Q7487 TaxID=3022128 RepID=UPI0024A952FF|nr:RNA degradosome polyphosphate kinase [Ligilactobacillus sp. Marseille-Q7487]
MSKKFAKHTYFQNRELSWLAFNGRVLEEARDLDNPLLERVNFLGITQSNVDEFFMVRVAALSRLIAVDLESKDAAGLTPTEQLAQINVVEHEMVERRYSTYNRSLIPQLEKHEIYLLKPNQLNEEQYEFIERYFNDELYPVLTPMADDSSRPFPFISNNSLNLAIRLFDPTKKEELFATIRVPEVFSRLVKLPLAENSFILLEDIIKEFIVRLFTGFEVCETATYRVIRDMYLDVAEKDTSDLLLAVKEQLKEREHGDVVRLEFENSISKALRKRLIKALEVKDQAIYTINGPLDLTFLKKLPRLIEGHEDLKYPKFKGYRPHKLTGSYNIFDVIKKQDLLLQHPYDSFGIVVDFIKQAALDPDVLAIKMTLYRVSGNSPIIKYLGLAAQKGKQVTVLVEVKARFDEQNNVRWAKELENMGCHVIYGLVGLKTHSKVALVIRHEEDGIRRYLHLGTGNYNDVTANFYTDMGLLTCQKDMGVDATNVFNMLSGYARPPYFYQLHISPNHIRKFIYRKIDEEIAIAKQGRFALIKMKMNSLSDPKVIEKLYEASAAGVKIQLIIRGICCLKTELPEVSENIEVHSIVGRFLEHSRIYYFYNDGIQDVYLSSADMMTRNLNRRVELMFPILQSDLKEETIQIFEKMWSDNVKARILHGNKFERIDRRGLSLHNCQEEFIEQALKKQKKQQAQLKKANQKSEVFIPLTQNADSPFEATQMEEKDND